MIGKRAENSMDIRDDMSYSRLGRNINLSPDDKIEDWPKLGRIADDNLKCISNEK